MSSRRLFLSGLRSSRARLRFAGVIILSNTKCRAPACEVYHEQRADSQQSSAVCQNQQLLALSTPNPGRILYLGKARSLSQKSGPPQLSLRWSKVRENNHFSYQSPSGGMRGG